MSHLRVKVCGITSLDDALWAVEAGADALGLIFVEGTPRYVTPAAAAAIVAGLPPFVCPVGVFWDHPPAHVAAIVGECGLGAVQLHGAEPPEVVAAAPVPVPGSIDPGRGGPAQLDRYKPPRSCWTAMPAGARAKRGPRSRGRSRARPRPAGG
jgi:hypothetical protein